ncbi:hypothetical protein [Deinococcus kurensis]|uniref:hypothetical protein n=1 Tax=Deinococcus kurensis TaxID=2662757 RepID=UPI0012D327A2|nr:hypothetical protein [Deinococcus kurensis]
MTMKDISSIRIEGTLVGTVARSAGGTPYFKDAGVMFEREGKAVTVPVRGFGDVVEGAESLINQKVLFQGRYALEAGREANAGKVFANIAPDSILPGTAKEGSRFEQTGYISDIEEKGKIKVVKLLVSDSVWNKDTKTRDVLEKDVQIAFFGDSKDQLDNFVRGQQVLVGGYVKTSGEKNYLDFVGETVDLLGAAEEATDLGDL